MKSAERAYIAIKNNNNTHEPGSDGLMSRWATLQWVGSVID